MAKRDVELIIKARDEAAKAIDTVSKALKGLQSTSSDAGTGADALGSKLGRLTQSLGVLNKQFAGFTGLAVATRAMEQAGAKTARLAAEQDRLKATLADLNVRHQASVGALTQANAALTEHQQKLKLVGTEYKSQRDLTIQTGTSIKKLETAVRAAGATERNLATSLRETGAALQSMEATLATQASTLNKTRTEVERLTKAQGMLVGAGLAPVRIALNQQSTAVAQAAASWKAAVAEANRYASETAKVGRSTRDQADQFNHLKEASRAAKQELIAQGAAFSQIRAALDAAKAGTISFADAQQRLVAIEAGLAASLAKIRGETATTATSLQQVAAATTTAASSGQRLASSAVQTGSAMQRVTVQTRTFGQELRKLGESQRTALSFMQRLRAQVLSLGSAYIGFFGIARGIGAVINATKDLQAAQTRMNIIFSGEGGAAAAAKEMDFLRRMANRLGLELGGVAQQFTIFASSTQGTNVGIEDTRKIFVAVSEAARVLGLSVEDQQGVFKALGQIASKGTLQMEELRGQLGDRMPGALKLMADGLKMTVKELQEATKQGKISADALIPFAEEITRLYGPGLAKALETTAAKMGMLGQAVFSALVRIGQSGFIDSFNAFIDRLTEWFKSAEADAWFNSIGSLLSTLTKGLIVLIDHVRLVTIGLTAFFSMKVGGKIVTSLIGIAGSLLNIGTNARTASVMIGNMSGRMAGAAAAAATWRAEMLLLMGSTGIGLAVAAIGTGLAIWATRTDDATTAMNAADKIIDEVKDSIEAMDTKTVLWAKHMREGSVTQLTLAYKDLAAAVDAETAAVAASIRTQIENDRIFGKADVQFQKQLDMLEAMTKKWAEGTLSTQDFKTAIDDVFADTGSEQFQKELGRIQELLSGTVTEAERLGLLKVLMDNVNSSAGELADAIDFYMASLIDAGDETANLTKKTQTFGDEAEKAMGKAEDATKNAIKDANNLGGIIQRASEGFRDFGVEGEEIQRGARKMVDGVMTVETEAQTAARLLKEMGGEGAAAGREIAAGANEGAAAVGEIENTVTGAMGNIRTVTRDAADEIRATSASAVEGSNAQAAAVEGVAQKYHNAAEAAAAHGQIVKETDAANIESTQSYNDQLDAAAEAYSHLGAAFEGVPDPFGTLKKSAEEYLAVSKETGVSVDDLKARSEALQKIFSIIDPGGFLRQYQKDAIALGGPLTEAQQKLLDVAGVSNIIPGPLMATLQTQVAAVKTSAQEIGPAIDAVNTRSLLPNVPAEAAAAGTAVERVKDDFARLADVGPEIEASVSKLPDAIKSQFDQLAQAVRALIADLKTQLASLQRAIAAAKAEAASAAAKKTSSGGGGIGHAARGGLQRGPGSGTSDSFLSFLSNGEYVIKAAAVRRYGVGMLNALNGMMMPKFAAGGPVSIPVDVLPHFLEGGSFANTKAAPTRVVNLSLDGQQFNGLIAPEDVARKLLRYGRGQQLRSGGRKPRWYGRKA